MHAVFLLITSTIVWISSYFLINSLVSSSYGLVGRQRLGKGIICGVKDILIAL